MVRREDSERKILDTARDHFLTYGYQGTKLRDIAKSAGMTTGALYHHYAGKDTLFVQVCIEGAENLLFRLQSAARRSEGRPVEDRILSMFDAYTAFFVEDRAHFELLEKMLAHRGGVSLAHPLVSKVDDYSRQMVDVIVEVLRAADKDSDDIVLRQRALLLVVFAEGLFQSERKGILQRQGIPFADIRAAIYTRLRRLIESA
jgi:AcrR family transcriptional regulator